MDPLAAAARHGRWVLIAGLVVGFALPPQWNGLSGYIREAVVVLLFLSVLRVGPQALLARLGDLPRVIGVVLGLQFALPLLILGVGSLLGAADTPLVLAAFLATAAPAIVGSPNICAMLGVDPTRSLVLLITGAAILPLTIIPLFWLSPQLDSVAEVLGASLVLMATLGGTLAIALAARRWFLVSPSRSVAQRIDGLSAIVLAVFVVGLMPDVRTSALTTPLEAGLWLGFAIAINWGAQWSAYAFSVRRHGRPVAVANGIYAGNRNIALFLVALPHEVTGPIMVFVGCYQIPMYLTPIFMGYCSRR